MRSTVYPRKITPLVLYIIEVIDEFQVQLKFNRNKIKAILKALRLFHIILVDRNGW